MKNNTNKNTYTQEEVNSLRIGDLAPNCFGQMAEIVEIAYRGTNIHGQDYIGLRLKFGDNSTISQSITADMQIPFA